MKERIKRGAIYAAEILDLPPDSFVKMPQIYLNGNREMTIEGHHGIVEYTGESIKLSCGDMLLIITGRGLNIKNFSCDYVIAAGAVEKIEFSR